MPENPIDLSVLEPGQLSRATRKPFGRAKLSRGALALLIALRIYVLLALPIVGYAFARALAMGH